MKTESDRPCPVPGCTERTQEFMCAADWKRVSGPTRRAFVEERKRLVEGKIKKLSPLAQELVAECIKDALKERKLDVDAVKAQLELEAVAAKGSR